MATGQGGPEEDRQNQRIHGKSKIVSFSDSLKFVLLSSTANHEFHVFFSKKVTYFLEKHKFLASI